MADRWPERWPVEEEGEEGEGEEGKREERGVPEELARARRIREKLRRGEELSPEELRALEEEFWKAVRGIREAPEEELPRRVATLKQLALILAEAKWGTKGLVVAKELLGELPRYYGKKFRAAVREVRRGARPEMVVAGMPRVIAFASISIATGALSAYVEGMLRGVDIPGVSFFARALAELLAWLYLPSYLGFIVVLHALAATVLLSITKVVRSYAYRRTVVDMLFWTVFAAAVAAVSRAAWLPFLVGFAAWPLLAITVALMPLYFVLAVVLIVVLLFILGTLAYLAGKEGAGVAGALSKVLLAVSGGPVLVGIGIPAQLFSIAKVADAAWDISDVPLAFLVALFSLMQQLAPPLAATVLAGVWIFFGTVAAATREWGWLRIPIAALVVYSANLLGYNYDLAASAAVEAAKWLGSVTGSEGVKLAADIYAWMIRRLCGVEVLPVGG
jgi:hypothetical protein